MEQSMEGRPDLARAVSTASWPAIIAGAFVAASVSLVLFTLGSGLGFAEVSPWPGHGATATTFAITTAIWLVVMQWVSSGVGGYITGRLRTRWHGTHTHEVFFRDTAHGLVTWAVATVLVAGIVAASVISAIGGGVRAGAHGAGMALPAVASAEHGATMPQGGGSLANEYGVDKLFRSTSAAASGPASSDPRIEAAHIVANAWTTGAVPDADRSYLAELVAARTGATSAEAQRRADEFVTATLDAVTKAKAQADAARKTAAQAAIYLALSMLVGAFIASVSAALGGRLRDEHL
jgi:hypothetical protein